MQHFQTFLFDNLQELVRNSPNPLPLPDLCRKGLTCADLLTPALYADSDTGCRLSTNMLMWEKLGLGCEGIDVGTDSSSKTFK